MIELPLYILDAAKPKPEVLPPALSVEPTPGLKIVPFLACQSRIRLCQPGDPKSKIVDLVLWLGLAHQAAGRHGEALLVLC